jgi:hypothetical protein
MTASICVLLGCTNPSASAVQPCDECLALFGDHLVPTAKTLTEEAVTMRNQRVRKALRANALIEIASQP